MESVKRGSSTIDWCESNYSILPGVAEFYNTVSNIFFFLFPPLLWYLYRQYSQQVNNSINIMWLLFVAVGASSVYFHATLSLVGQLLDELSIIWVVMCGVAMWFPRRFYPKLLKGNRRMFKMIVFMITMTSNVMACIKPALNSFFMMPFVLPCVVVLYLEMKRTHCLRIRRLGVSCAGLWFVAVSCWVNDKLFCDTWQSLSFPYLHCFWHLLVFISGYTAVVLFSYFDAMNECPEMGPVLKYWPKDTWEYVGIPYVTLRCAGLKPKD
ncbi:alkaline ceramidase 2-like [Antedon mediterranea]|uniref:alkaline ceramidase 2-like n=1 Tax=Antedon mediterranea TaxID=105859 RepID=UPI003AF55DAD